MTPARRWRVAASLLATASLAAACDDLTFGASNATTPQTPQPATGVMGWGLLINRVAPDGDPILQAQLLLLDPAQPQQLLKVAGAQLLHGDDTFSLYTVGTNVFGTSTQSAPALRYTPGETYTLQAVVQLAGEGEQTFAFTVVAPPPFRSVEAPAAAFLVAGESALGIEVTGGAEAGSLLVTERQSWPNTVIWDSLSAATTGHTGESAVIAALEAARETTGPQLSLPASAFPRAVPYWVEATPLHIVGTGDDGATPNWAAGSWCGVGTATAFDVTPL